MKALKWGIALCAVMLTVGIVGTGASLGNMYQSAQLTHETKLEEALDVNALKNIHIQSDVPLRIVPTTGEAKITFEGYATGLIVPEPMYAIDVNTQGDASYITIKNKNAHMMTFLFDGSSEEAVLYLPEQDVKSLKINTGWGNYVNYQGKANIEELTIDGGHVNLDLEGNIGKVDLDVRQATVDLETTVPADVKIVAQRGEINLEGQYKKVNLADLNSGEVSVQSTTPYEVQSQTYNMDVMFKGPIQVADVRAGEYRDVTIESTIVPKRIAVEAYESQVRIQLPETTPGVKGVWNYHDYDQNMIDAFGMEKKQVGEYTKQLQYGEGGTELILDVSGGNIYILK
ncbi:MAG: DUF4097 family beta strand repeat-containing protein [Cellulosilyticaceae bacterium]